MRIRTRRALFLAFVLIFLIATPLLLLYGLGYKYNWQKNAWEKTGVFFVKSFPRGGDVYLNGVRQKQTTPTQLTRLLPKTYDVKIAKAGFRPWVKNLPIQSQAATFIEDVSLIYEQPRVSLLQGGAYRQLLADFDRENFALVEQYGQEQILWLYQASSDKFTQLYKSARQQLKLVNWSVSNKKLLFKEGDSFLTIHKDSPGFTVDLQKLAKATLKEVAWDSQSDNLLYALKGNQLVAVNLLENSVAHVNQEKNFAFLPYKNGVLALVKNADGFFLKLYLPAETKTIFSLPEADSYRFSHGSAGQIILHDQLDKQLFLINPEDKENPVKTILKNVAGFNWLNQAMVYWDNSELWVYYLSTNQQVLLERTSQKINSAFWHPNAVYVYAEVGNRLKLYELDSRDSRNVYDVLAVNQEQSGLIYPNKKGSHLLAVIVVDNSEGFYKFAIQP